jgi:hypothetical protein
MRTFYIENDAEIFPVHYTWKVAEKGFKMAFMTNKLAMINFCEIILEKYAKNHCEIQVHTILVCTLYLIKYGKLVQIRHSSFKNEFKIIVKSLANNLSDSIMP